MGIHPRGKGENQGHQQEVTATVKSRPEVVVAWIVVSMVSWQEVYIPDIQNMKHRGNTRNTDDSEVWRGCEMELERLVATNILRTGQISH